jgi:hypothetical protein
MGVFTQEGKADHPNTVNTSKHPITTRLGNTSAEEIGHSGYSGDTGAVTPDTAAQMWRRVAFWSGSNGDADTAGENVLGAPSGDLSNGRVTRRTGTAQSGPG